jgi:membrane protein YdbS with pleckstrin-like domain
MSTTIDEKIQKVIVYANKYAWNHYQVVLDLDEHSIDILNEVINKERDQAARSGAETFDFQKSSRIWGIYFGELIRKTIGGIWYFDDGTLSLKVFREILAPVELVRNYLEGRDSVPVISHYADLCKRISEGTMIQEGRQEPVWDELFQGQEIPQEIKNGGRFQTAPDSREEKTGIYSPRQPNPETDRERTEGAEIETSTLKPSIIPTLISRGTLSGILVLLYIFLVMIPSARMIGQYNRGGLAIFYLLSLLLIVILCLPCAIKVLKLHFTEYTITNNKIILDYGILSRTHKTIPLHKIQDIGYTQTIIERLFEIGDVAIESAGEHGAILLLDLPDCEAVTRQILRLLDKSHTPRNNV